MEDNYNILTLKFSDSEQPEMKEIHGLDYIRFGKENNYPDYLTSLYNKSAKHAAIINGKVSYIFGSGLKAVTETPGSEAFIKSISDTILKSITDTETYGGFYWQVIPNIAGTSYYIFHIGFDKMRSNKTGSMFYYKNDWADRGEKEKPMPAFVKGTRSASIFCFKEYRSGQGVYALPKWWASCNYIESDIEISKATLTNAKTGFSGSKFINFFNGKPNLEAKREVTKQFRNEFGGATGERVIIGFNEPGAEKPTIDDLGASDLTKEDFTQVDNLITSNIFAAHSVTHPLLFGIQQAGKLGSGNELRTAYDIFKNTYVNGKQKQIEGIVNEFAELNNVGTSFILISSEPIGLDFSDILLLQAAPRSWILDQLGIDTKKYTDAPIGIKNDSAPGVPVAEKPNAVVAQNEAAAVNDNIKNLTAKQHQQLLRIIRQYSKGQLTKETATVLLKTGLGLNDTDIAAILVPAATFSKALRFDADTTDTEAAFDDEESVAMLFNSFGESMDNFTVILSHPATFAADEDALLAGEAEKALSVIDKVKKIAKKFEVRYSYQKRAEATGANILPTTRPFCRQMITSNKAFTRTDIQNISQLLGYDVFLRTGGFWNNNGTTETHCRHEFKSHVIIRKS